MLLDIRLQGVTLTQRPVRFSFLPELRGDLRVDGQRHVELEGHKQAFTVVSQFEAVIPVGFQAAREAMFAGALEVEFHRAPQVTQHAGFAFVGKGQQLLVKGFVPCLRHVRGDGVEEPQAVIRAEVFGGGGFLGAGVVVKRFDHRDGAAVGYLAGEHQFEARAAGFGVSREHAQHILHGIAEAQAVTFAVIYQRGRT